VIRKSPFGFRAFVDMTAASSSHYLAPCAREVALLGQDEAAW
jgi:hypothetical protein